MGALSKLFDAMTLIVPCSTQSSSAGEIPLEGHNISIVPLSMPAGRGLSRKLRLVFWLLRNSPVIFRELLKADAVHAPIPGDIGTIGMLLAFAFRKPLFVRHCGNWLKPVTTAEYFWKWFMQKYAGSKRVMLATGGSKEPASRTNAAIEWIFATSLSEDELQSCKQIRELRVASRARLIIVCRQDREKGTGVVIQSLPLILKDFPDVSLDVVGEGDSLAEFKSLAGQLGVSNRITFHGRVDHAAVISLLKQADLFCYPTQASEGFPKVVLEALACGLPVVTTRVSVLPELMQAGGGQLLEEPTSTAVAEAVCQILSNSDRYGKMSASAIETANQYSLERWGSTIGDHLRNAWGELRSEISTNHLVDLKSLKICFLAGTLGRGGAERQLIYMLKVVKSAGIKVRVLCLTRDEPLEEEIRAMGIQVIWVGAPKWRPVRLFRIIQELRRDPVQIVQSAHFYTNLYAAAAARALRIKSIGAIRSNLTSELQINGKMGWWHLHLPHKLIANSELAKNRAIAAGLASDRVDFVRNAVTVLPKNPRSYRNGDHKVKILFAGRLCEPKRPDRFLRVMNRIIHARPELNVRATIVGDGPLRSCLEEQASALGLRSSQIEFLGELKDVKPLYYASDLLLLTSDWEGTPNVVLEAMGCGLPVVATRVGGVPGIIGAIHGLVVDPSDEEGLADATLRMIDDRNLRTVLGFQGSDYVARFHSMDVLKGRLTHLYHQMISK